MFNYITKPRAFRFHKTLPKAGLVYSAGPAAFSCEVSFIDRAPRHKGRVKNSKEGSCRLRVRGGGEGMRPAGMKEGRSRPVV